MDGFSRKLICQRYGIANGTLTYWVNKLGEKETNKGLTGYDSIQIIKGKKSRVCANCGIEFQPYIYNYCSCYTLCFDCYTKAEYGDGELDFDDKEW
jgi:hypothetical protein